MRINERTRSQVETKRVRSKQTGQKSFAQMVQSQSVKLNRQELDHMMDEISKQGDRLNEFRSVRQLVKFKRLVKGFLEKTVGQGYRLQISHEFNIHGNNQKMTLVEEIDEHLVQLTEQVMHQEEQNVDLLGLIGEIKGLLLNLYT